MKLKLPTLTKTQKIIAVFALATLISFLVWGCKTPETKEVKKDSTITTVDTARLDTLKQTIMAKSSKVSTNKTSFGKRKGNQTGGVKSYNKHTPKPKQYRGQGR